MAQRFPKRLIFLMWFFLLLPLWSLSFLEQPLHYLAEGQALKFVMVALAYWITPVGLAAAIYKRAFGALPLLALEAALLLAHTLLFADLADGETAPWIKVGLIAFVALIFFVFVSRDIVIPFLSTRSRAWRLHTRLDTNLPAQFRLAETMTAARGIVANISATGVAASIPLSSGFGAGHVRPGTKVILTRSQITIECQCVWSNVQGEFINLGLKALDLREQAKLLNEVRPLAGRGMRAMEWARLVMIKSAIEHMILLVWRQHGGDRDPQTGSDGATKNEAKDEIKRAS